MKSDTAKAMLVQARSFDQAASLVNSAGSQSMRLLIPSWVLAALALEIVLKCLYLLDLGSEEIPKTHDLSKLFCALRSETQTLLTSEFEQCLRDRDMRDVAAIEAKSGICVPRDLLGTLQHAERVFVECRYIYEAGNSPWAFMFYSEAWRVFHVQVLRVRPDIETT